MRLLKFLRKIALLRPHIIWNQDSRNAFNLVHDAAAPGLTTFPAYGIAIGWTFWGIVIAHHYPYKEIVR